MEPTKPKASFSNVTPYILDIGHGNIRAGYGGDYRPSLILPSVIGTGDDYNVFPVTLNANRKYPYVEQLRNFTVDSDGKTVMELNKAAYIRAIKGIIGDQRLDDRNLLNIARTFPDYLENDDDSTRLGITTADIDCWDDLNCNAVSSHYGNAITSPDDVDLENIVKRLHRCNTLTVGLGEQPGSRPMFIVESNEPNLKDRQEQLEIIMEDLELPGAFFGQSPTLSTFVYGISSAVVVDIGAATTSIGVVIEDELTAFKEFYIGGDHVDALLYLLLREAGEHALNGVFYHPSYCLGTQLWDNLYEEQLPVTLATKPWKRRLSAEQYNLQEMIKAVKESVIHVAPYPLFSRSPKDETKYRDILRAAAPRSYFYQDMQDGTLPDGAQFQCDMSEPRTPDNSFRARQNSWILMSSQRTTPRSDYTPRTIIRNESNPFENVSADSLLATAAEIIFDPCAIADRLPVDVGNFNGLLKSFDSLISQTCFNRPDVHRSVIVVGGCANMRGILNRIENDLIVLGKKFKASSEAPELKIHRPPNMNRSVVSWAGASMLTSISSFDTCWITQDEYRDHGTSICLKKGNIATLGKNKVTSSDGRGYVKLMP